MSTLGSENTGGEIPPRDWAFPTGENDITAGQMYWFKL